VKNRRHLSFRLARKRAAIALVAERPAPLGPRDFDEASTPRLSVVMPRRWTFPERWRTRSGDFFWRRASAMRHR